MIFGSMCSGIEAASVAFNPLGWKAKFFSEIEPFACAVLRHHYPNVLNLGDMNEYRDWPDATLDVLCGGTPCQSYSNAGLRAGLDDPRGELMLTFGGVAARYRPRWVLWENVPGVLSSNEGRDFGTFLGLLGVLGYGFAYRVFDAQYFGLAQRRKRVFVVARLGDWRRAAAVLFEREGLRWNPPPSRSSQEDAAARALRSSDGGIDREDSNTLIAHTLKGEGFDASEDGTGRGVPLVAGTITQGPKRGGHAGQDAYNGNLIAFGGNNTAGPIDIATGVRAKGGTGHGDFESETFIAFNPQQITSKDNRANPQRGDPCHPLTSNSGGGAVPTIAFHGSQDPDVSGDVTHPAGRNQGQETCALIGTGVRRLMPIECERLQGFPDNYTAIKFKGRPAKDGPRYKAIGNSWAVPNVRWIGRRIQLIDSLEAT